MAQGKFSAKVSAWVAETKARHRAVFRESAQRIIGIMQTPVAEGGRMRVDTGFLRASLRATLGEPNFTLADRPDDHGRYEYDAAAVELVISQAEVTDKITAVYTARYARAREYKGDRFVGLAAQQWPQIVEAVCREAKARAGA